MEPWPITSSGRAGGLPVAAPIRPIRLQNPTKSIDKEMIALAMDFPCSLMLFFST